MIEIAIMQLLKEIAQFSLKSFSDNDLKLACRSGTFGTVAGIKPLADSEIRPQREKSSSINKEEFSVFV